MVPCLPLSSAVLFNVAFASTFAGAVSFILHHSLLHSAYVVQLQCLEPLSGVVCFLLRWSGPVAVEHDPTYFDFLSTDQFLGGILEELRGGQE